MRVLLNPLIRVILTPARISRRVTHRSILPPTPRPMRLCLTSSARDRTCRFLPAALRIVALIALTLAMTTAGCSDEPAGPQDPHAFGRALVTSLKAESPEAYQSLIYTKGDIEYMLSHRTVKGKDPEALREGWTQSYERRRDEIERSFSRLHREGVRHGLEDWSAATFKTIDFQAITEGGFTRYEMIVEFTAKGRTYVIDDATAWKTDRGLVLQAPPTLLSETARRGLGR